MASNPEIARAVALAALPKLDPKQIIGSSVTAANAKALGKKFGDFYLEFYAGVLTSLVEADETSPAGVDAPYFPTSSLNDSIQYRGRTRKR